MNHRDGKEYGLRPACLDFFLGGGVSVCLNLNLGPATYKQLQLSIICNLVVLLGGFSVLIFVKQNGPGTE